MATRVRFDLSAPEAVARFRELTRQTIVTASEYTPELRQQLHLSACELAVHPHNAEQVVREVLALPAVVAAFEAAERRKVDLGGLSAEVRRARPGDIVRLRAGTYRLGETLVIDKPLTLQGEGFDRTSVAARVEVAAVRVACDGAVVIRGIAFELQGGAWADGLVLESGEVRLEQCRVSGAVTNAARRLGGCGIRVAAITPVSVLRCLLDRNDLHGILVVGEARPVLEGNTCVRNGVNAEPGGSGIVFSGASGGAARRNECTGSGEHGLSVEENAAPELEGNTCLTNRKSGIHYAGAAAGGARDNTCSGNLGAGITVAGGAAPTLEVNRCDENQPGSGIVVYGRSRAVVRGNGCRRNAAHGIAVDQDAAPRLDANVCEANAQSGIAYGGTAAGAATGNVCTANQGNGITVRGSARPLLERNACERNHQNGIGYGGRAAGVARANRCDENDAYGIFFGVDTHPGLERNTHARNGIRDVGFDDGRR